MPAPERDPATSWPARHRAEVESLLSALTRAESDYCRAVTEDFDPESFYERHPEPLSARRLGELRAALAAGAGELLPLVRYTAEVIIARRTRAVRDEIAAAEWETLTSEGLALAQLRRLIVTDPDPELNPAREGELGALYAAHVSPVWTRCRAETDVVVRELGYPDRAGYLRATTGVDPEALAVDAQLFLERTRTAYQAAVAPLRAGRATLTVSEILGSIRRSGVSPGVGPTLRALTATVEALGLERFAQIELDLEDREGKAGGAFCSPIQLPGEIVVSIQPHGGIEDCRAVLHEIGHALHFSYTDPTLPVERRRLGDTGLVEAWGMLFEHLFLSETWLAEHFPDQVAAIGQDSARRLLLVARLQSVRHLYEWQVSTGTIGADQHARHYRDLMLEHLDAVPGVTEFERDRSTGFAAAVRLRSWSLELAIRRHLEDSFGAGWMNDPAAGAWLRAQWWRGQPARADDGLVEMDVAAGSLALLGDWLGDKWQDPLS